LKINIKINAYEKNDTTLDDMGAGLVAGWLYCVKDIKGGG